MSARNLRELLQAVRRRWLLVEGVTALARLVLLPGLAALFLFLADNLTGLPAFVRAALSASLLAATGALAFREWRRFHRRRPRRVGAALAMERAHPELRNLLVNAVLLEADAPRNPLCALLRRQADEAASALRAEEAVKPDRLRRLGLVLGATLLAWAVYAAAAPEALRNAYARYRHPLAGVTALGGPHLAVEPGDAEVLAGHSVEIEARVLEGPIPPAATLLLREGAEVQRVAMAFVGNAFRRVVPDVQRPFRYRVEAGGWRSSLFQVRVVVPPHPVRFEVTYRYPAYTGWAPRREAGPPRALAALAGTRIEVEVVSSAPLRRVAARLGKGGKLPVRETGPDRFRLAFTARENDELRLRLEDSAGHPDDGSLAYPIQVRPDRPPTVHWLTPARDGPMALDEACTFRVAAADDVGLAEVLLLQLGEPERVLARWRPAKQGGRRGTFSTTLLPRACGLRAGEVLVLAAEARDVAGQRARSGPRTLRLRSGAAEKARLAKQLASILQRLIQILERQKAYRTQTEVLRARWRQLSRASYRQETRRLAAAQAGLRAEARGVLADWADPLLYRAAARIRLAHLVAREMTRVVRVFETAAERPPAVSPLVQALGLQTFIIRTLEEIIAATQALQAELREKGPEGLLTAHSQRLRRSREKLERILADVKHFIEEQKRVIQTTEGIRRVNPQDFTGEEKEKLGRLAGTESEWGKFFKEAWTDLSKLYPQDFSNSTLASELLEAYSEVELAADALTRGAVEIAVPYEQSGLELAESITRNIERWLADVHDYIKWRMEDPPADYEVPMADLPEELEDLIGDLIDSEEQMTEATEDVTSGWMDSLNEGAGWTAMDGPISNMSARGITGNLLPNSQEIGGRSGEGRTGKSLGQMVEKTATGKGGRKTPTRYTPDPFEGGEVKDTSTDPAGGATGGGKLSGAGEQGLRGVPSPLLRRRLESLAKRQSRIRQQAERLRHELKRRRFHSLSLEEALRLMRLYEEEMARARPRNYTELARAITRQLHLLATEYGEALRRQREGRLILPPRLRASLHDALAEPPPAEFRRLIEAYYRALTREAGR